MFIDGEECTTQCSLDTNSNLLINVGTITQDTLVHMFSSSAQENVGFVTIRGSSANSAVLRVQVCEQSISNAYFQDATTPLAEGFHNFGGIRVEGPTGPNDTDTSLLDHSALTLAIAGDVTGNVEVGQIYRFDVQSDVNANGGNILGEVTTKRNVAGPPPLQQAGSFDDISYLRAANLIAGNIIANRGPISKIVVGPNADAVNGGIRGNIVAVWPGDQYTSEGAITSVFTTGPLGAPTGPIEVQAFNGITEVLARVEGGTQTLARDFHMNLDAGDMNASVSSQGTGGRLTLVDTSGDISGRIRCGNLRAITCEPNCTPRAGVYARGNIDADIEVGSQVFGNIIGRTITGSVSIGHSIEGMIVGWDVDPTPRGVHAGYLHRDGPQHPRGRQFVLARHDGARRWRS